MYGITMTSYIEIYNRLSLLKDDPEQFEIEAKKIIEEEINTLPEEERKKASQQQWVIDGELRKYKDPIASYNVIIEMLFKKLKELDNILNGFDKS